MASRSHLKKRRHIRVASPKPEHKIDMFTGLESFDPSALNNGVGSLIRTRRTDTAHHLLFTRPKEQSQISTVELKA